VIEGSVNAAYEAVVRLPVRGPAGETRQIDAVIDTGFTGFLTVPPGLVEELGLLYLTSSQAVLANGSEETFDVYGITLLWNGRPRFVDAFVSNTTPLAGMRLLDNHRLFIDVVSGGQVTIHPNQ